MVEPKEPRRSKPSRSKAASTETHKSKQGSLSRKSSDTKTGGGSRTGGRKTREETGGRPGGTSHVFPESPDAEGGLTQHDEVLHDAPVDPGSATAAAGEGKKRKRRVDTTGVASAPLPKSKKEKAKLKLKDQGKGVDLAPSTASAGAEARSLWARLCDSEARSRFPEESGKPIPESALVYEPSSSVQGALQASLAQPLSASSWGQGLALALREGKSPSRAPGKEGTALEEGGEQGEADGEKREGGVGPSKPGMPAVLVLCPSALRCTELLRQAKELQKSLTGQQQSGADKAAPWRTAKLFSKHMKVAEQTKFLEGNVVQVAAGTPNRLLKLLQVGALNLDSLFLLVLDLAPSAKELTMLEEPQVRRDFQELYFKWLHDRVCSSQAKVGVCRQ